MLSKQFIVDVGQEVYEESFGKVRRGEIIKLVYDEKGAGYIISWDCLLQCGTYTHRDSEFGKEIFTDKEDPELLRKVKEYGERHA